ncbi:MAG: hypothetical protein IT289_11400 [Oligoflexia bacterium]|nr:hypothetical protein [Oligoflexia bacterium]
MRRILTNDLQTVSRVKRQLVDDWSKQSGGEYFHMFSPSSRWRYERPTSVLLADLKNFRALPLNEPIIVRDGALGLTLFFKRFPEPINLKLKLYIHEKVAHVVPGSWRRHLGMYRLYSRIRDVLGQPRWSLILAQVSERSTLPRWCVPHLKELNKSNQPLGAYFPIVNNSKKLENKGFAIAHFFQMFFGAINRPLKFLTYEEFYRAKGFSEAQILDLNDHRAISDSDLVHYALQAGGHLFKKNRVATAAKTRWRRYLISEHHGFELRPQLPNDRKSRKTQREQDAFYRFNFRRDLQMSGLSQKEKVIVELDKAQEWLDFIED